MQIKVDITVLTGVSAGDVFHFSVDEQKPLSVGRATECDLVLQDALVSRRHVQLELMPDGLFLVDLGSTHGTFHMGFHLKPGPEGKRQLSDNDEFKIGELLFRVHFDETPFQKVVEAKSASASTAAPTDPRRRRRLMLLGAVAAGALLLLLLPEEKGSGLPAQRSNEVALLPTYGVVGYWTKASHDGRGGSDRTHLDKAQFELPGSNVVIEYDYVAEAPVTVKFDDVVVETLPPTGGLWRVRQLISRGLALGVQRRLIFDNEAYPPPPGKNATYSGWGVRDIRQSPLTATLGIAAGFDNHLRSCIGLVESMDKSPAGLFLLERGLQLATVELLNEAKIDAVGVDIDLGSEEGVLALEPASLRERLQAIEHERTSGTGALDAASRHVHELARMIGQVDAELWRRVNSRLSQARLSVQMKTPIDAYDGLRAGMGMFPAEDDYRWTLLNRLYMNPKVVPPRVRDHPEKYRPRVN